MIEGILEVHLQDRVVSKFYPPKGEVNPDDTIPTHVVCCVVGWCDNCKQEKGYHDVPSIDGKFQTHIPPPTRLPK